MQQLEKRIEKLQAMQSQIADMRLSFHKDNIIQPHLAKVEARIVQEINEVRFLTDEQGKLET